MHDKEYQKKVNEWFIVMIIVMLLVTTIVVWGILREKQKALIHEQDCKRLTQTSDTGNKSK